MVQPLRDAGYRVYELDTFFSSIAHFRSIKLIHLNWFENIDDSSYVKALFSYLKKMFVLTVISLTDKRLVWTMHNRMTHEKKTSSFSHAITKRLIRLADAIVIHSEQSRALLDHFKDLKGSVHYIPHPDFIGSYGALVPSEQSDTKLKLLFVGTVKPYKNIELLIDVVSRFEGTVELTLAGNPHTQAYKEKITQIAALAGNVTLMLHFIPDEQLPILMAGCDLLVLPYDLNSSLNSGSVILAFSYRKTVLCPAIGTLSDMNSAQQNFLSYRYDSPSAHADVLADLIAKAVVMKKEAGNVFEKMGNEMYAYVRMRHGKQLVSDKLINIYNELLVK